MRRLAIVAAFLLIASHEAFGGTALSLKEAERIFLEENLEIKTGRAGLKKADADLLEAKTLPNPSVNLSIESMRNGERETEETYSVTQGIDLSGRRKSRIQAAQKGREAQSLFLDHEITELRVRMRQTFYRVLLLKENEKALSEIVTTIEEVEGRIAARVEAGDAAEADLMKIVAEKKKVLRNLAALRADLKAERNRLGLFLNRPASGLDIHDDFRYFPLSLDAASLTNAALANRPDLKAQDAAVEGHGFSLSSAHRGVLPLFELEAGYKRRTGGFHGFVFGISIPLPFFDRNQAGISRAQAELEKERMHLEAMKKNAEYEVRTLADRAGSLQTRITDLTGQMGSARELTKIAEIAYGEGEAELLDLLDAVRTERELVMEQNDTIYEYWALLFELERATGRALIPQGGHE